jgi:ATP-dependent Clp protease ATP-binding subunit ClpA
VNFHASAKKTIDDAFKAALDNKYEFITPELVLKIILKSHEGLYERVDQEAIIRTIDDFLDKNIPKTAKKPMESVAFGQMLNSAADCANNAGKDEVDTGDLLAGIWNTKCQGSNILRLYKIERNETIAAAQKLKESREIDEKGYLGSFCVELVAASKANKYDPVIGRDDEIERTIEILCRKKKNDPLLRGEPGSGKCLSGTELITVRVPEWVIQEIEALN